ncbi:MAG TPA: lipopolysaccharide kinase InaA family protein [Longimicrobiales bacterium]|nr:lipopolysaccharide kinase InaA family protein [Longimicrobiales bacterium]
MTAGRLPAGYDALSRAGVRAFAWAAAASWVESVLVASGTLYDWSSRLAADSRSGRGPVNVVDAPVAGPDRAARWAVRHYRRGGRAAPLLGDRYWGAGRTRPERELEASVHARARGIRTPAVVAGAVYRATSSGALGFYRADLVTELVPGAQSLAEALLAGGDSLAPLRRTGALVRALHGAGVLHPDLNAGNVVLDEEGEAWVLDLDRARRLRRPSRWGARAMLARLERSLRKLERARARPISHEEWATLRSGFEEGARA